MKHPTVDKLREHYISTGAINPLGNYVSWEHKTLMPCGPTPAPMLDKPTLKLLGNEDCQDHVDKFTNRLIEWGWLEPSDYNDWYDKEENSLPELD